MGEYQERFLGKVVQIQTNTHTNTKKYKYKPTMKHLYIRGGGIPRKVSRKSATNTNKYKYKEIQIRATCEALAFIRGRGKPRFLGKVRTLP